MTVAAAGGGYTVSMLCDYVISNTIDCNLCTILIDVQRTRTRAQAIIYLREHLSSRCVNYMFATDVGWRRRCDGESLRPRVRRVNGGASTEFACSICHYHCGVMVSRQYAQRLRTIVVDHVTSKPHAPQPGSTMPNGTYPVHYFLVRAVLRPLRPSNGVRHIENEYTAHGLPRICRSGAVVTIVGNSFITGALLTKIRQCACACVRVFG